MKADAPSEKILFDFQAATHSVVWQIVNDDVMGGVSTSQFQLLTNGCAVFSGVVSLENNGGFASARSSPVRQDLSGLDAFVLRARAAMAGALAKNRGAIRLSGREEPLAMDAREIFHANTVPTSAGITSSQTKAWPAGRW